MKQWIGLGLLGVGAALCAGSLLSCREKLVPGMEVRKELRDGESDEYPLSLEPGQVLDVAVEQKGIDVALILSGPGRDEILHLDTPTGAKGLERLFAVAEVGGTYRLRVHGGDEAGTYVLRREKLRSAGPRDRLRARAFQEYSQGDALRRKNTAGDRRQALVHYGRALDLFRTVGDTAQQIVVFRRECPILRDLGPPAAALEAYRQALFVAQTPLDRVFFLNSATVFHKQQGKMRQALEMGEEALALAPRTGDAMAQAAALNNLGIVYRALGENDEALRYFRASLEKWQEVEPKPDMAMTLTNSAETLYALGSPGPALRPLFKALAVQEALGDHKGQAMTFRTLGVVFNVLGKSFTALRYLELARERAHDTGDRRAEALALNDRGAILLDTGEADEAWRAFSEAGRIAREARNPDNEAFSLSGRGAVLVQRGDGVAAIEYFARSADLYTRLGDPNALSGVLYLRALAEQSLGRIDESLKTINLALDLVELLRGDVSQSELQAEVIGARTDLYDLKVDLLLRLDERRPGEDYDARSFAASEWRRARSLLETVKRTGGGNPGSISREALRRQAVLRLRLQDLASRKLTSTPRDLPGIKSEIQATLALWEGLIEEIRSQSPAYAAVTAPKLVSVADVQELLDRDTALVAYTPGEKRSILWWIDKGSLQVRQDLPPRAELERLASQACELMSRPGTKWQGAVQVRLEQLGEALLGPIADRLPRVHRLVVVADESLQALPFAALLNPGSGEPLVESHAVVQLPSASLAAALRERQERRAAPQQTIAVFADPVFGGPGSLARLPESRREAKAILALVPPDRSRWFFGFDANRRAALDPDLARFRYIHFATHGIVDLGNPSLSGIQLSRIDARGRRWEGDGILPFYEVYNLSLPADLVTLSACRTAAGLRIRGEGTLALSRSFLYAGASRVLGALWDVDDTDAADLMILFYQALLRNGQSPALALQHAQKTLRSRARQRAPYHWAGFVLQGDWH